MKHLLGIQTPQLPVFVRKYPYKTNVSVLLSVQQNYPYFWKNRYIPYFGPVISLTAGVYVSKHCLNAAAISWLTAKAPGLLAPAEVARCCCRYSEMALNCSFVFHAAGDVKQCSTLTSKAASFHRGASTNFTQIFCTTNRDVIDFCGSGVFITYG